MAKLKLNFMGFHTYAWKQGIVEPLVWIGEVRQLRLPCLMHCNSTHDPAPAV